MPCVSCMRCSGSEFARRLSAMLEENGGSGGARRPVYCARDAAARTFPGARCAVLKMLQLGCCAALGVLCWGVLRLGRCSAIQYNVFEMRLPIACSHTPLIAIISDGSKFSHLCDSVVKSGLPSGFAMSTPTGGAKMSAHVGPPCAPPPPRGPAPRARPCGDAAAAPAAPPPARARPPPPRAFMRARVDASCTAAHHAARREGESTARASAPPPPAFVERREETASQTAFTGE